MLKRPRLALRGHGRPAGADVRREGRGGFTWLFDLDNTLHDASHAAFGHTAQAMTEYIGSLLGLSISDATELRQRYWKQYGATLLGMVRHHGVKAQHFLDQTHQLPDLEQRLRCRSADRAALRRLPGDKYIVTNGPRGYAERVLERLRLAHLFRGVITIEDMVMFGEHRPKPDARMLRRLLVRLRCPASRCVLVEDTLSHQKSARSLGMRTVWMQAYLGLPSNPGRTLVAGGRPPYVSARIRRIRRLHSFA